MASKYTPEQLSAMAATVLIEENRGSPRPLHFYITVAQRAGLTAEEVRNRTIAMSEGPFDVKA